MHAPLSVCLLCPSLARALRFAQIWGLGLWNSRLINKQYRTVAVFRPKVFFSSFIFHPSDSRHSAKKFTQSRAESRLQSSHSFIMHRTGYPNMLRIASRVVGVFFSHTKTSAPAPSPRRRRLRWFWTTPAIRSDEKNECLRMWRRSGRIPCARAYVYMDRDV